MSIQTQGKVTVKLFAGFLLNSEMKMHLGQSSEWKQVSIMPRGDDRMLTLVSHQGKEYLGVYFPAEVIMLKQLKSAEVGIRDRMNDYLSDFDVSEVKVKVFYQVFVA